MGKINDYATGTVGSTDKLLASDGTTGVTKNLLISDVDSNFANTDLNFTGNRNHNTAGFDLEITTDAGGYLQSWWYFGSSLSRMGFDDNYINLDNNGIEFWNLTKKTAQIKNTRFETLLGISKKVDNINSLVTLDDSYNIVNCTSNTFTINLPTAVGIKGVEYIIKNSGSGVITLEGDGTETIDGALNFTLTQYVSVTVVSDGTNWIIINF